ncbi:MAG: hypothetical protein QM749_18525 [Aquabacterium sp.]
MRPLFAIAPLALVLTLIGPTPNEANQSLTRLLARFTPSKVFEGGHNASVDKPSMMSGSPALTAMQSSGDFDSRLSR